MPRRRTSSTPRRWFRRTEDCSESAERGRDTASRRQRIAFAVDVLEHHFDDGDQRQCQRQSPQPEQHAQEDLRCEQCRRRNVDGLALDQRGQDVAFEELKRHVEPERAHDRRPAGAKAGQHDDDAGDQRTDGRDECQQAGLEAEDERAGNADDAQSDPGDHENHAHGGDLAEQPAPQRFSDVVDQVCGIRRVLLRHEAQQSAAIDLWLQRQHHPEQDDDKDIADGAEHAEQEARGLAEQGGGA